MKNKIDILIEEILKIPRKKIATLTVENDSFIIDIDENKKFGYAPEHQKLFVAKLSAAMIQYGGLIIREFLPLRVKRIAPNGKEMWLPEKNIYGIMLGDNSWVGLDERDIQLACRTDAVTGVQLLQEEGTHYKAFPLT